MSSEPRKTYVTWEFKVRNSEPWKTYVTWEFKVRSSEPWKTYVTWEFKVMSSEPWKTYVTWEFKVMSKYHKHKFKCQQIYHYLFIHENWYLQKWTETTVCFMYMYNVYLLWEFNSSTTFEYIWCFWFCCC
jgi:hypothetical protein